MGAITNVLRSVEPTVRSAPLERMRSSITFPPRISAARTTLGPRGLSTARMDVVSEPARMDGLAAGVIGTLRVEGLPPANVSAVTGLTAEQQRDVLNRARELLRESIRPTAKHDEPRS